jgi:acyl-CoA thioesterase I
MRRHGLGAVIGIVALLVGGPRVARAEERVIVVLGDSLTAGYGVAVDEAYPARLAERLRREGLAFRVVNAGVSGDTTAGALRRVDWVLRTKPAVVIVALGANDGLRGQSPTAMRRNLETIVTRLRAAGARVLLAGMRVPPNYGDEFARDFAGVFPEVARRMGVPLMPFLLDGVAAVPALNQPDGIHPNAEGHRIIAERLWPHLRPLLGPPSGNRPGAGGRIGSAAGDDQVGRRPRRAYRAPP